jgi:hypothetical protein
MDAPLIPLLGPELDATPSTQWPLTLEDLQAHAATTPNSLSISYNISSLHHTHLHSDSLQKNWPGCYVSH